MVDPDIRRLLDTVFNVPDPDAAPDVAQLRAAAEQAPILLGGTPESVESVADMSVPGASSSIGVRVYRPRADGALSLMLYTHGGGWVTGSLESHDRLCRLLANRLSAVIVAVDYRCAPEHIYPAALDDTYEAWLWACAHAHRLGAEGKRFAVAGDSSGGNLAAALTLRLRARNLAQPRLQLLLYPALDASCSRGAYREFVTGFNLSAAQMAWYWSAYQGSTCVDAPQLSPLASSDLSALAPALIAVAECDVLRDDGLTYAHRLHEAGVTVRVIRCEGMIHGFLRWTGAVPAALRLVQKIANEAKQMLAEPP